MYEMHTFKSLRGKFKQSSDENGSTLRENKMKKILMKENKIHKREITKRSERKHITKRSKWVIESVIKKKLI